MLLLFVCCFGEGFFKAPSSTSTSPVQLNLFGQFVGCLYGKFNVHQRSTQPQLAICQAVQMSCKNIPSLGQLFIKCEDIPRRYSAVLCLELSLVTLPVDSGRSCIFSPSCKAIHSEKEGGKKKKKKSKHPPPWCSSELSPLLWLAKQLVLIHLSPLLIKNKKCHSLLELQDPPSGEAGLSGCCIYWESSGRVEVVCSAGCS